VNAPRLVYVVDGYNVLHALFAEMSADEQARRRDWLAGQLASFAALRGADVVLVWDARGSPAPACDRLPGTRVEVCYAGGRFSADTLIARRIAEQPPDVSVVVVSGDQEVQRTAARAGVRRMTPRELGFDIDAFSRELALSDDSTRMRTSLEDKVDLETWRKLERMRTQGQ
jgi:predicted RNA-binding protein with PIN domain